MPQVEHWPTTRVTLLTEIRDGGDGRAWRQFVGLYTPLIYGYCRKRGLQDADAQNVTQEVFARVMRAIQSFEYDPDRGRFRSWLGLITHQQILRYHHKLQSIGQGIGAGVGDAVCESMSGEVDGAWFEAFNAHIYRCARDGVRGEFDDATWTVFIRVWEKGEPPRNVASQLGREPAWVYQAKFKVVQRIRQEIIRLCADMPVLAK